MKKLTTMKLVLSGLLVLILVVAGIVALKPAHEAAACTPETPTSLCPNYPDFPNGNDPPYLATKVQEVSPTVVKVWWIMRLFNNGPGNAYNVKATLTYAPANITYYDKNDKDLDGVVVFGNIPAHNSKWSTDTFCFRMDLGHLQYPGDVLVWRVEYDDAASCGHHYVIPNVLKYCEEDIHPNTTVTITASASQVEKGKPVTLTVTEQNTGDIPLRNPRVVLSAPLPTTLTKSSASFIGGDSISYDGIPVDNNGILDPGETWTWKLTSPPMNATTTFVATGHGIDPFNRDITYPQYCKERDSVTVTVAPCGGATRTPGFWQTHLDCTKYVFETFCHNNINIGWKDIKNVNDLMGIFWASPAKDSDGDKRTPLCQAKEITAFQAVAAVLNSALPNGAPLPVPLEQIQAILSSNDIEDINKIQALGEKLDRYNNSGDRIPIDSPVPIGNANPKAAQATANEKFADCAGNDSNFHDSDRHDFNFNDRGKNDGKPHDKDGPGIGCP